MSQEVKDISLTGNLFCLMYENPIVTIWFILVIIALASGGIF